MIEKKIGIIGAMDEEVSKLKDCLEHLQVTTAAAMDLRGKHVRNGCGDRAFRYRKG